MRKIAFVFFMCCGVCCIAQESFMLSSKSVLTIEGTSTAKDWEVSAESMLGHLSITNELIDKLNVEVHVAHIKSERGPSMDNKIYAALKGEEHPKIIFITNDSKTDGVLTGALTIAGIEKEIESIANVVVEKDQISISGDQKIRLEDFGVVRPSAMFGQIVVGELVTINYHLIFTKD